MSNNFIVQCKADTAVMTKGRYIDEDDPELYGQTAIIMATERPDMVQAQFDNIDGLGHDLTHSWIYLPRASFDIEEGGGITIDIEAQVGPGRNDVWHKMLTSR